MRRLPAALLTAALAFGLGAAPADGAGRTGFPDVPPSSHFAADIDWLVDEGITGGYADGTFRPGEPISRQHMAAFLHRLAGEPEALGDTTTFTDVPPTSHFHREVAWLVAEGITGGYADGTFRPRAPVTRQHMAAFLHRLAGAPTVEPLSSGPFSDVPADHTFAAEIAWLADSGVTGGYADGTFRPRAPISRQHMAAFLHRFSDAGLVPPPPAAPTVTAVSPDDGPTAGGTVVTITGTDLRHTTAVAFGSVAADFDVVSRTQITASAPAGSAGTVDVRVTTPLGTSATHAGSRFTYLAPPPDRPAITGVSPATGSTAGDTFVTITGTNLANATAVAFGGAAATMFYNLGPSTVMAKTPAHAAGTVDVTVTTAGGTSDVHGSARFTFVEPPPVPVVDDLTSDTSPTAGGQETNIRGSNLAGVTAVLFGTVPAAEFRVLGDSVIYAVAPAHPAGEVHVTLVNSNGVSATHEGTRFLFHDPGTALPIVTSVAPSSGLTSGMYQVSVHGLNLTGATGVTFGDRRSPVFWNRDDSELIVYVPSAQDPGPVEVTVTTGNGTSTQTATFTYVAP